MFEGEEIFKGSRPIKYVFQKSRSPFLVVVFSGFPSRFGIPPVYNYIKTLSETDCNKLFILDDNNHTQSCAATYYLGFNRDHSVEMSVIALITKIANENGIEHKHIIAAGSSKGGFASLYFGLKYSFGHVISGGAQTLLGSYLMKLNNEIKYIAGFIAGSMDEDSKKYLDSLLFDAARAAKKSPDLYIHVGKGDHHYEGHILPFINLLNELNIPFDLDIGDYQEHAQLGEFYPKFLLEKLDAILIQA
ncbi:hypothetical protein GXP70_12050 [Paenibacillus lycopersici]|uniref:Esterase n=1 Tax=Paenibacillus lycopersici TaxID=2704462 RepID=A0A6C0FTW4_9BACL|nr:hypothetical protein [Paenibacillus lycopersici]QHT60596.1 hypothetical protein GXP70_12050 [Paenibacillus lycopersici]